MIHRRIIYGLTLVAVFLFQITNQNYLAHFLLILCIALPLLSLAISLPGMLSCRLRLAAEPDAVSRGEEAQWTLSVENRAGLPIPRLLLRLESRNRFTGRREKSRLVLSGLVRRKPLTRPAHTDRCGLLEFKVTKVRVYDCLGLFSIRRPLPEAARLLSLPVPVDPGPLNLPEGQGVRLTPAGAAKGGWGEDYDLREYRPGDPMRSVHWKLSSKWDELIVREPVDTCVPLPLLTFDRFGPFDLLEPVLDRLLGYCQALLAVQRPHAVLWLDDEVPSLHTISDLKDLRDCLLAILSSPAPEGGVSILDRPELIRVPGQNVFHLHIDGRGEDDHG